MANAGSTSSSLTSTSHTMTAFPNINHRLSVSSKPSSSISPAQFFLEALTPASRYNFIAPAFSIPDASLGYVKEVLDSFAGKLGDEQADRLKEQRKKRKRGDGGQVTGEILKIRKVYIDGFGVDQVWEQARRVIDALKGDAERVLGELGPHDEESAAEEEEGADGGVELMEFDEDGFEIGSDGDEEDEVVDEAEDDMDTSGEASMPDRMQAQNGATDEDSSPDVNDEDGYQDEEDESEETNEIYLPDPNGLNDGFFTLDSFNKQTEFLEQQDSSANPFAREDSDEEEIDWEADPLARTSQPVSSSRSAAARDVEDDDEELEEEDEEDGPTFGNMDLNAPEGESEGDEDTDMEGGLDQGGDNANDVFYKDFFEPPPRKAGKGERQSSYLERQARKPKVAESENVETEIKRAMADVRRDLFDDDPDIENSEDALSDVDPADPKSRKSAHERRQAKIAEEIRRLEAASVAKREWALSGEARAADRPLNSLLDEDLEFERTGKPVLEVTVEISESIEELIKRRILAQEFDEVIRRRPDDFAVPTTTRRGAFELDDSKPQQSLAEMYEEEHVKANNPDAYVSRADEKLRKEEKEIEFMWKEVSAKLDALSSWHYKPKPAAPSLTVVSDVATVAMEDAQPTTASGISGGESMLAPQEIYKAGKEKGSDKTEVIPKSGAPIARQEMTREEKLRRRRREKERIKKRGGVEASQRPESKNRRQKRETLGELKKGGVKVIGKKGDIRDVEGNKIQASASINGAGSFKL